AKIVVVVAAAVARARPGGGLPRVHRAAPVVVGCRGGSAVGTRQGRPPARRRGRRRGGRSPSAPRAHRGPDGDRGDESAEAPPHGVKRSSVRLPVFLSSSTCLLNSCTARLMCMLQNFGPHMEQNSALLKYSSGRVSSCIACAVSGSSDRRNCSFQSNAYRARDSASSRSRAPGRCRATSEACAAIL